MFKNEIDRVGQAAADKVHFLNENPGGYFASSLIAGMYIGFGILLSFTIGSLGSMPLMKLFMGMSFACALSLVIMAGAELFTGNNMVMATGFMKKTVSAKGVLKLWLICYVGNWLGSILLAWIFSRTGLMTEAFCGTVANVAAAKVSIPFGALLLRATLCNMLVCLGVWCSMKMTSESGKLIMIFWIIVIVINGIFISVHKGVHTFLLPFLRSFFIVFFKCDNFFIHLVNRIP